MLNPEILRDDRDFASLYKRGRSSGGKYLVLIFRKNGLSYNRRAFVASKKVGNSVKRNRARRLLKESYRCVGNDLKMGYDILFIARNGIDETKCYDIEKSMTALLRKNELFS